jgi:hypothetical protein
MLGSRESTRNSMVATNGRYSAIEPTNWTIAPRAARANVGASIRTGPLAADVRTPHGVG